MNKTRLAVIHFAMVMLMVAALSPGMARATTAGGSAMNNTASIERVQPIRLADVVVNPSPPTPAPAFVPAAPAPAPMVEAPPAHRTETTVVEHEQHNYMTTIAVSALMGGLAGALVGGSIYFLNDNQTHPSRIGYWAAGGVLVGGAVGLTQVVVQEARVERATASMLPTDPVPTFRLALVRGRF